MQPTAQEINAVEALYWAVSTDEAREIFYSVENPTNTLREVYHEVLRMIGADPFRDC